LSSAADGRVVAMLAGEFDLTATTGVAEALRPHLDYELVVDLEAVTFMDSSGLQCLLRLWSEADSRGGRLMVGARSEAVEGLFRFSGLGPVLLND
jgi:anti-anti-sigma factor